MTPRSDDREVLRDGELTVIGRIRSASNGTFLCESTLGESSVHCVYKPVAGEAPLWDFPDGTLAGRERAAYLVSAKLGWNIVPYTIIRHGPAGPGMLQRWVQQPGDAVDTEPRPGPDLVDLFPAGTRQPGYLPVLRAPRWAPGIAWRLAGVGLGALATSLALVWYLVAIARIAMDYQHNALIVQGGWLVVRVLGLWVVVAAVLLGRRMLDVRASGRRVAPGVTRLVGTWAGAVGTVTLLVVLAYWGVFQLGI